MAIVAYRQPITVPEINDIRGVNSSGVIRTLLDRKMIKIAGRKNVVGSPFLYRTTREFLLHFGLESIQDLPKLEEFSEILGESLADELLTSMSEEDILDAPPSEDGEDGVKAIESGSDLSNDEDSSEDAPDALETESSNESSEGVEEESLDALDDDIEDESLEDEELAANEHSGLEREDEADSDSGERSALDSQEPASPDDSESDEEAVTASAPDEDAIESDSNERN